MRRQRSAVSSQRSAVSRQRRAGTTLTEVLMALMVMGIGIVTLATLFPIAVLRTMRANQLTNSAILARNAETLINTYPHLVHDPDNDGNYYLFPGHPGGFNNNRALNDPRGGLSEHSVDEDANGNGDPSQDDPANGGNGNGELDRPVYVVDPMGYYTHLEYLNGFEEWFGNDGNNSQQFVRRFNGAGTGAILTVSGATVTFPTSKSAAATMFTQADSWTNVVEEVVSTVITNSSGEAVGVTLPTADLTAVTPSAALYRVILFDSTGRGSLTRRITWIDTSQTPAVIHWDEDANGNSQLDPGEDANGNGWLDQGEDQNANGYLDSEETNGNGVLDSFALPPGFEIERVRVEAHDPRFTWMLTVRKQPTTFSTIVPQLPDAEVDVVVFFNRSYSEDRERLYMGARFILGDADPSVFPHPAPLNPAGYYGWDRRPGVAGFDDDGDGNIDEPDERGTDGSDDNRTAYIPIPAGVTLPLDRGDFVFEARHGYWYRIRNFRIENGEAVLLLDGDIGQSSFSPAMLPDRVVEVFRNVKAPATKYAGQSTIVVR